MTETIDCMVAPKCNAGHHFQRIEVVSIESGRRGCRPPVQLEPYGLDAGRMAACSAGGAARRPAPVESVVDLGPTYTAKPYASWPGYT